MTQIGREAIPQRSLEKPYLLYFYAALRLVTILLNDYTCLQLALQIWLWQVLIFATADLKWADVAWGCDILQRQGIIYGGIFISYISYESGKHRCSWCVFEDSLAFGGRGIDIICKTRRKKGVHKSIFDSTRGYPGEGPTPAAKWSNKFPNLTMATWNTRSLTFERFQYCLRQNYDVLALTELWRNQANFQTASKNFTVSEPKLVKIPGTDKYAMRFPEDKAAGVGILLSDSATKKVESFGSEGERICWVRLEGPVCHLFVIAVYLPHRGRVSPSQDDTLQDLHKVLKKVPKNDCICILGDLNEQLAANVQGATGPWTGGPPSKNSDKIIEFMRMYDLRAANTYFEPKKHKTPHTYLYTESKAVASGQDLGIYVGERIRCTLNGQSLDGDVIAVDLSDDAITNDPSALQWTIRFDDGHIGTYDAAKLKSALSSIKTKQAGKQIDYPSNLRLASQSKPTAPPRLLAISPPAVTNPNDERIPTQQ